MVPNPNKKIGATIIINLFVIALCYSSHQSTMSRLQQTHGHKVVSVALNMLQVWTLFNCLFLCSYIPLFVPLSKPLREEERGGHAAKHVFLSYFPWICLVLGANCHPSRTCMHPGPWGKLAVVCVIVAPWTLQVNIKRKFFISNLMCYITYRLLFLHISSIF